jgi:hypothetical protein
LISLAIFGIGILSSTVGYIAVSVWSEIFH